MLLCSCDFDLDLDPMTLILDLALDVLKMYMQTKTKVSRSKLSKVRARTGQTDRHTHTDKHNRMHYNATFTGSKNCVLKRSLLVSHFLSRLMAQISISDVKLFLEHGTSFVGMLLWMPPMIRMCQQELKLD